MDRKNIYKLFYGAVLLLILGFCVRVGADFFEYNVSNSAPFYIYVIMRGLEFLLPGLVLFLAAGVVKKKSGNAEERTETGRIRFLFLVLAVVAAVYTAYGFVTDIYINDFIDRHLRSHVTIIGGADGPTSVFVAYNIPMIGNWMMSCGFTLGCIDAYLYMKSKSRRRSSLILPVIASALGILGAGIWIFRFWDIFQYWEMTWEYNFPAVLMLLELALPIVILILRIKQVKNIL